MLRYRELVSPRPAKFIYSNEFSMIFTFSDALYGTISIILKKIASLIIVLSNFGLVLWLFWLAALPNLDSFVGWGKTGAGFAIKAVF